MRRRARLALLAAAVLLGGCRQVIALGDSNTCGTSPCGTTSWASELERHVWYRGWKVVNRGTPGMSAGRFYRPDGQDTRTELNEYAFAAFHLERLLAEEKLARACRWLVHPALAPVVVIALGTNDVVQTDGDSVAADILALDARIHEVAPCVRVLIGLVPPRLDLGTPIPERVARANQVLRARVPPERLVDFDTGFDRSDLMRDGVHVTPAGQVKRAEVVRRALAGGGGG